MAHASPFNSNQATRTKPTPLKLQYTTALPLLNARFKWIDSASTIIFNHNLLYSQHRQSIQKVDSDAASG